MHSFSLLPREGQAPSLSDQQPLTGVPLEELLRAGAVEDVDFDAPYPSLVRAASSQFWTPIAVALRAAELLVQGPSSRVLDVGSGPGKFCIVGAAATGATFVGVEHRTPLVEMARAAAKHWGVGRATFVEGGFDTIDIAAFDAVYFFNPFQENLWMGGHFDRTIPLSEARYGADIEAAEALLAAARGGTRVVTYHGFGGEMPAGYQRAVREHRHTGMLELWIKDVS